MSSMPRPTGWQAESELHKLSCDFHDCTVAFATPTHPKVNQMQVLHILFLTEGKMLLSTEQSKQASRRKPLCRWKSTPHLANKVKHVSQEEEEVTTSLSSN